LIDKSLVQVVRADGAEPRFAMMETVREFARERLTETGDTVIAEAHAAYYLNLAETAASAAGGAARESWMRRIATERPNLRAALDWFRQSGQTGAALQMTGALWHYWYRLGELSEGRAWLEQSLAAAPPDVALDLRARALRGAGVLAWQSTDYDGSREWLEAALTAYETLHDRTGAAWVLKSLGCLFATRADRDQAEQYLTASLAIFREFDDAVGIAQLTANLGELAQAAGDHHLAIERLETALAMWRALGDRVSAARALGYLGQALLERGESAPAEAALLDALTIIRDVDYEQILPTALRVFARLTAARGNVATAARWYGAEATLRHTLGITLPAARRAAHEEAVAAARKKLGAAAFDVAWAAGRTLSPEDVVAEVFASAHTATTAVPAGALPAAGPLSRREREVLALLIEGHSDRTIADALFISQRTASDHVGAILRKLGVSTRAEAAVRAVRDGLG
jgi:non-specific serine/threonine protein kinase